MRKIDLEPQWHWRDKKVKNYGLTSKLLSFYANTLQKSFPAAQLWSLQIAFVFPYVSSSLQVSVLSAPTDTALGAAVALWLWRLSCLCAIIKFLQKPRSQCSWCPLVPSMGCEDYRHLQTKGLVHWWVHLICYTSAVTALLTCVYMECILWPSGVEAQP